MRGHFLRPVTRALEFPSRAPVLKIPNSMRRHTVDVIGWNVQSAIFYRRLLREERLSGVDVLAGIRSSTNCIRGEK